jgi:hypothetical protein
MAQQHIRELLANGSDRIEGAARVLRDQRDFTPAHLLESALTGGEQINPAEHDAARSNPRCGIQQTEERIGGDRLSGAALPDKRHRFAPADIERYLFERPHGAAAGA